MCGNTGTEAGINRLFFVVFVLLIIHIGQAFHESFFNGLQEIGEILFYMQVIVERSFKESL